MKILGIICEYNPFHNGHLHQINTAVTNINPDYTIAIMSGNFAQRGEMSILNKWERAKIALQAGIDLVLELPFIYACQSAEYFAFGAIDTLVKTGIITHLSFGSESNNLSALKQIAQTLHDEPQPFRTALQKHLANGESFAKARALALESYFATAYDQPLDSQCIQSIVSHSNDILGIEYIKALLKLNASVEIHPIKRQGPNYHSLNVMKNYASATKIRASVKDNTYQDVQPYMPHYSYDALLQAIESGNTPSKDIFSLLVLAHLRQFTPEQLSCVPGASEGLEFRLLSTALKATSLDLLVNLVKTKRYAYTRIQRIVCNALFNITTEKLSFYTSNGVPYLRILGFRQSALPLLTQLSKYATRPIISKPTTAINDSNTAIANLMQLESNVTDLYYLCSCNEAYRIAGNEFSTPIVKV